METQLRIENGILRNKLAELESRVPHDSSAPSDKSLRVEDVEGDDKKCT